MVCRPSHWHCPPRLALTFSPFRPGSPGIPGNPWGPISPCKEEQGCQHVARQWGGQHPSPPIAFTRLTGLPSSPGSP